MKIIILLFTILCSACHASAQINQRFCKAVEKGNLKKAERIFKREIKKRKNGSTYYNGPGSGMQITHQYNLDTLTMWLKSQPCVEDAFWDKCQYKIMIYPGWSIIGVKFKTSAGIKEKCFSIQEGTTGTINIFGWKPHIFKMKNKLVYKKMFACEGFIEQQKANCNQQKQ